jgi:hypothetical protein
MENKSGTFMDFELPYIAARITCFPATAFTARSAIVGAGTTEQLPHRF